MNIYVGNLAYRLSEDELRSAFEAYGEVDAVRIITDRETGRSKGYGFVEMPDDSKAQEAIDGLNGSELGERTMKVSEARPRQERRGGGGYNRY